MQVSEPEQRTRPSRKASRQGTTTAIEGEKQASSRDTEGALPERISMDSRGPNRKSGDETSHSVRHNFLD